MPKEDTQFKPGETGNPNGRPKGLSITAMVREELDKVPEGQKEKAKDLLVKRLLHKAISEGDFRYAQEIWRQIDGAPKNATDITSGDEPIQDINVNIVHGTESSGD